MPENKFSSKVKNVFGGLFQVTTAMFLLATSIYIRMYYKKPTSHQKSKIKKTVNFEDLTIYYGLGLLLTAIVGLLLGQISSEYFLPYLSTLGHNTMLFLLFISNKEALKYWRKRLILMGFKTRKFSPEISTTKILFRRSKRMPNTRDENFLPQRMENDCTLEEIEIIE